MRINVNIKKFYFHIIFSNTYEDSKINSDTLIIHEGFLNSEFHKLLEDIVIPLKDEILLKTDMIDIEINKRTLKIEISNNGNVGSSSRPITAVFKGEKGYLTYVTIEY